MSIKLTESRLRQIVKEEILDEIIYPNKFEGIAVNIAADLVEAELMEDTDENVERVMHIVIEHLNDLDGGLTNHTSGDIEFTENRIVDDLIDGRTNTTTIDERMIDKIVIKHLSKMSDSLYNRPSWPDTAGQYEVYQPLRQGEF